MPEIIIEEDRPVATQSEDPGCGCLSIIIIGIVFWIVASFFVDGGISCCTSILLVAMVVILYRLMNSR